MMQMLNQWSVLGIVASVVMVVSFQNGYTRWRSDLKDAAYTKLLMDASARGEPPDFCSMARILGHSADSAKRCGDAK